MISHQSTVQPEAIVNDIRQSAGHLIPDPHLRLGDADSAHGVIFGEMAGLGPVAVKPHENAGKAANEQANLERLAALGIDAVEPVRIAAGGLATYLIMVRRAGLRHLGQMNWRANIADFEHLEREIIPTLGRVATVLARWHGLGIFHGDAQLKNLVFDREGKSVFVDAEKTQFNPPAGELTTKLARKDIGLFGLSVLARGLLYDKSAAYRVAFMRRYFLAPYIEQVQVQNQGIDIDALSQSLEERWSDAIKSGWTPKWAQLNAKP